MTPGVFVESRQADRVFFVDKLSERDDVVNNVFVQSTQNNRLGVMVAQKGYVETAENGDRFVVLVHGRRYEGTPGTLDYRTVDFDRYKLRIEPREAKKETPPAKAMGTMDLLADPTPHNIAELHWRIALPFSVVLMALFAVPLSFVNPRTGRSWNLVLAVLAYTLYNNLLSIFQAWTAQGRIPIWLGLWPVHFAVMAVLVVPGLAADGFAALVRVRALGGLARAASSRYNFGLPASGSCGIHGEVDERFKSHAWKACLG